jgi:hypothetical protein
MSLRPFRLVWLATAALALAPSVASAAWTVPPTPSVEGAYASSLQAVDCSSANSCIAVGSSLTFEAGGPALRPLAERWDGTSWQIVPTPDLPDAALLSGVSCPWPTFCFAVGTLGNPATLPPNPPPIFTPVIEVWNGTRWSIQSTPDSPGELDAVSCSGLLACTAVGAQQVAPFPPFNTDTLALRWEPAVLGAGWHVQPTPNAAGSDSDRLTAVSCPLKRTCTAVGQSDAGGVTSPLATRWFGRVNAWGLQSAPKPDGAEDASLAGVSCPVAPVCVAVGGSRPPAGSDTVLAERRIGPTWSLLPTPPLPPPSTGVPQSLLGAVSCPTLALCRAVGYSTSATGAVAIAERFDGTSWQLESIPARGSLAGVSCPSRFFCMAVGGSGDRALSAKWTP